MKTDAWGDSDMERASAAAHVFLYVTETVLQVATALVQAQEGLATWSWLIIALIITSSFGTNVVSIIWVYRGMDFADRRTGECLCVTLHTCQLGLIWRCLKIWLAGDSKDNQELSILRLVQTSVQSAPFIVLQMWIAMEDRKCFGLPAIAILISFISLVYTYTSNTEPFTKGHSKEHSDSMASFSMRLLSHGFLFVARTLALAAFAIYVKSWLALAVVGHFVISTLIIIAFNIYSISNLSSIYTVVFLATLQSYGCIFGPVPLRVLTYKYLAYFAIIFIENVTMATVWFVRTPIINTHIIVYSLILFCFITGFSLLCVYTKLFHNVFFENDFVQCDIDCTSDKMSILKNTMKISTVELGVRNHTAANNYHETQNNRRNKMTYDNASLSLIDDLDEIFPSPYFLAPSSEYHQIDVLLTSSQTASLSGSTPNTNANTNADEVSYIASSEAGSSGCYADTSSAGTTSPDRLIDTKEEGRLKSPLNSTPKSTISAIEITPEERRLIDSLLHTGECLLDEEHHLEIELSSSGCFGDSSQDCSLGSLVKDGKEMEVPDIALNCQEVCDDILTGMPETTKKWDCTTKKGDQEAYLDDLSTSYQTISSCLSEYLDRRLPSVTSSITRAWADAAESVTSSSSYTCTTCHESYIRDCGSSTSWSCSTDLLESDADYLTWPPRRVNIVNIHNLPREKSSLDERVGSWLKSTSCHDQQRKSCTPTTGTTECSKHQRIKHKVDPVYSATKPVKRPGQLKPFSFLRVRHSDHKRENYQKQVITRSRSLSFIMKLYNATNLKKNKVILFNHLKEECQKHCDPSNIHMLMS